MNRFRRKRSTAVITIIALLFSILTIFPTQNVYAGPDLEGPAIHGDTLTKTLPEGKTEVTAGDTVDFSVKITDDTDISSAHFYFENKEAERSWQIRCSKIEGTDFWECRYKITEQTPNGEWTLSKIKAFDAFNNDTVVERNKDGGEFLSVGDFTVYGNNPDTIRPVIHADSFTKTMPEGKTEVEAGDTIEFSVRITDDSGVRSAHLFFANYEAQKGQDVQFLRDGDTDIWKARFNVTETLPNGVWTLSSISAYDTANLLTEHKRDNEDGQFLSIGDFSVVGNDVDITPPVIYPDTLTQTLPKGKTSIMAGETVEFKVKITDNLDVRTAKLKFYNYEAQKNFTLDLHQVGDTDIWKAQFTPTNNTPYGKWLLSEIYASDILSNHGAVRRHEIPEYMSKADFTVTPLRTKVRLKLYGHDDILATWDALLAPEGSAIKYKVEYKRSTWDKYTLLSSARTGTSYKKANLVDGARYRFRITPYAEENGKIYEGTPAYSSYIYTLKKIAAPRVSKSSRNYVRVRWTNIPGESGYQISRSRYKTKGFKTVKRVSYKYSTTTAKTIRNRTYYYKIRAYKTVDGKRIYAPWSAVRAYKLR